MEHLDFSSSGKQKAVAPAAPAPLYNAAVARAFFESAGREETVPAGTKFFVENE